jgi:hypothetical protein
LSTVKTRLIYLGLRVGYVERITGVGRDGGMRLLRLRGLEAGKARNVVKKAAGNRFMRMGFAKTTTTNFAGDTIRKGSAGGWRNSRQSKRDY